MAAAVKLLFTGRGTSGSWKIRGEQLGAAIGATVKQAPSLADCRAVDLVVVVKRVSDELLATLRASGTPWVFDCVDFYPQPACSAWEQGEAIDWVRGHLRRLAPAAVIWPNLRMREDCDIDLPGLVLPHHHRPGIKRNPIRKKVEAVGYEGSPAYLGAWRPAIEEECRKRGWRFCVNPNNLADLDIVIAMRDRFWGGYVPLHWKSNVKLANAHGSGTPFVGQREWGYLETATGAEYWADGRRELGMSFDWLTAQSTREQVADRFLQRAFTADQAAAQLQTFLDGL